MQRYKYKYSPVPNLVSIIIPTHNRAYLLPETLASFENQDYDDIEIIIVDDRSTDNTKEIVEALSKTSSHTIHYINSDGVGANHARNIGMLNSKGEYIQFFDSDDIAAPNFISCRIDTLRKHHCDFCTCNFKYFEGQTSNIVGYKTIDGIEHTVTSHLNSYSLPTQCFLFRRTCLEAIGFWHEKVRRLQDMCYYQRLFKHNKQGIWMDTFLFYLRRHEHNITHMEPRDTFIYSWSTICKEWRDRGMINDVRVLCIHKIWNAMAELRIGRKHKKYVKNIVSTFIQFPYLFSWYIIKVKILHKTNLVYGL